MYLDDKYLEKKEEYEIGYTTVKFKVLKTGDIRDPEIIKSFFPEYDEEVKKIIFKLPRYPAAKANEYPPAFYYCLFSIKYPVPVIKNK